MPIISKRTPEQKAAAKIKREKKFAFQDDIHKKVDAVFGHQVDIRFGSKSIIIRTEETITLKLLNELSCALGTDAINSYMPSYEDKAGYIEVMLPIPQDDWLIHTKVSNEGQMTPEEFSDKIIADIEVALKLFGTYHYFDKGPGEVMDVPIEEFKAMSVEDVAKTLLLVIEKNEEFGEGFVDE